MDKISEVYMNLPLFLVKKIKKNFKIQLVKLFWNMFIEIKNIWLLFTIKIS